MDFYINFYFIYENKHVTPMAFMLIINVNHFGICGGFMPEKWWEGNKKKKNIQKTFSFVFGGAEIEDDTSFCEEMTSKT